MGKSMGYYPKLDGQCESILCAIAIHFAIFGTVCIYSAKSCLNNIGVSFQISLATTESEAVSRSFLRTLGTPFSLIECP